MRNLGKHQVPCSSTLERIHRAAQCAKWAGARFWVGTRYTLEKIHNEQIGQGPGSGQQRIWQFLLPTYHTLLTPDPLHCSFQISNLQTDHFKVERIYLTVCRSGAHWRESTNQKHTGENPLDGAQIRSTFPKRIHRARAHWRERVRQYSSPYTISIPRDVPRNTSL